MADHIMDHEIAEATAAADRYLLNEIDVEERASFEAHFFDCRVCAKKVRQGAIFIDSAKQILSKTHHEASRELSWFRKAKFSWLRPAFAIPSFAALCLAMIVGYQNTVTLPALREPQVLSTLVVAPLSREQAEVIAIDPKVPHFNVNFLVDLPRTYPNYICQFQDEKGSPILALESGGRDVSSFTLSLLLPTAAFPDGTYELVLRPAAQKEIVLQRYTFAIRRGQNNEAVRRD